MCVKLYVFWKVKMVVLYHGTSSLFAKDIIENGLGIVHNGSEYFELKHILSKYIDSKILTDSFFQKYSKYIESDSYSTFAIRQGQKSYGYGVFAVAYNDRSIEHYHAAPEYAKTTTKFGGGEFEAGIVRFLNDIPKKLEKIKKGDNVANLEYKDFLELLINNALPKYKDASGNLYFHTEGNYEIDFPILIRFEVPEDKISGKFLDDLRVKYVIKPESITGIAFLPPFDYEGVFMNRYTNDLKFFTKDQFLKELEKRKTKRHWCEQFEVVDEKSGKTKFLFSFPTNDLACVQEYECGELERAVFYERIGHVNKGKIAEKEYKNGLPYVCDFFEKNELIGRALYKNGKLDEVITFKGKKHIKNQNIVIEYERRPQNLSCEYENSRIQLKKKEIRERLTKAKGVVSEAMIAEKIASQRFSAGVSKEK